MSGGLGLKNRDSLGMDALILIVNYRTGPAVVECLRSLVGQCAAGRWLPQRYGVIVLDSASGDGSADVISAAIAGNVWGGWVRVVKLARNGGVAFANNAGIRIALGGGQDPPRYIMLLNPDTIVHRGAIEALVQFLDSHDRAGIAGSQLEDADGRAVSSARRRPSVLGELIEAARLNVLSRLLWRHVVPLPPGQRPMRCDWVSGAAMMVRREVFEQVGLLYEGYFLYFEEVDFCDRARRCGWEVWHVSASRVMHLEGVATGVSRGAIGRRPGYWYDSRRRYFLRQGGIARLLAADAAWAAGHTSLLLRRAVGVGGRGGHEPQRVTLDLLGGDLRALIRGDASRRFKSPMS